MRTWRGSAVPRRELPVAALLLSLAAWPGAARGSPLLTVALDYRVLPGVAGGCPDHSAFEQAVIAQLDYNPFQANGGRHLVATVKADDGGREGLITWLTTDGKNEGERQFSSANPDCAAFVRGMTFAIAVQIQFLNSSQPAPARGPAATPASVPAAAPSPAAPSIPVAVPAAAPAPIPQEPESLFSATDSVAVGLGPTASVASGPSTSAGARVRAVFRRNDLSLEFSSQAQIPVYWRGVGGMGFSSYVIGVDLAPCGHWRRFSVCALGALQQLRVRGLNLDEVHSPASIMAGTGLRVTLRRPISPRLELAFYVQALYVLTPRTVTVSAMPVWTTPPLGLSLGFDLSTLHHLGLRL